ncbi:MAG: PQQ-dependent sugar dehydrogenase [Gemmatimonadota bacterium]
MKLTLQPVASGLGMPLYLTAPAGDSRLFIAEKGGRVRIVKGGLLLPQPFLDLSNKLSVGGEQGLLGIAFHPRYASNGILLVDYTDLGGNTRIVSYRVSADPDRADPASERTLLAVDQPFGNHNGGQVAFGPDGMLYIGMGDGGSGGDPRSTGQDARDLLGALLRIEVLDDGSHRVPIDNPSVGQSDARPEVWSIGLRNPWRFAFDRANGDLYIADVGQGEREEINVVTAATGTGRGANFGWAIYEGSRCFGSASKCTGQGFVMPTIEYTHAEGCSVTGGFVYRGSAIPSLRGSYFYSDYCSSWIRSFRLTDGTAADRTQWTGLTPTGQVLSFGEDAAGELYVMSSDGHVWRIAAGE